MQNEGVAGVILKRADQKVLLQYRDALAPRYPLVWGFFGGKIEINETPLETAIREAKEELGITVYDAELMLHESYSEDSKTYEKWLFCIPAENHPKLTLNEGQALGWFSKAEIEQLPMAAHDKQSLNKLMDRIFPLN